MRVATTGPDGVDDERAVRRTQQLADVVRRVLTGGDLEVVHRRRLLVGARALEEHARGHRDRARVGDGEHAAATRRDPSEREDRSPLAAAVCP